MLRNRGYPQFGQAPQSMIAIPQIRENATISPVTIYQWGDYFGGNRSPRFNFEGKWVVSRETVNEKKWLSKVGDR
jgi:hypothetical protein